MVKFGIIGCGVIAPLHAHAISKVEGANLVAVCDIIEEKAKNFAEKYAVKQIFTDYQKMINEADIDAVCVCTPSGMHGEMAIYAANAGKHLLIEKPVEITAKKLDDLIYAVEKNSIKASCVFQRRMQEVSIKVKKALESGEFGRVLMADAYLKYYRDAEYYKSADWRATWELDGGGALMNQGVHGVEGCQVVGPKRMEN